MFLSKYRKQTTKLLRLPTRSGNHRNKQQKPPRRSNFYPKNMCFYGFLNRKLKKSNVKLKGRRIIRTLPVMVGEKLDLKWVVEGSEMLRLWKNSWKFSKFLRYKVMKMFQTSVWTIYTHFTNLSKAKKLQSGTTFRMQLSTQSGQPTIQIKPHHPSKGFDQR